MVEYALAMPCPIHARASFYVPFVQHRLRVLYEPLGALASYLAMQ